MRVVAYDENGYGNYISIQQEDGFRALYCHLEKVLVKSGDIIEEGQIIGTEGTSGNSTGVHLHLEIRKSSYDTDDHINVAEYLGIKNEEGMVTYIQNYELLEFLGIMDYWRQGYKGKGVTIASRESEKTCEKCGCTISDDCWKGEYSNVIFQKKSHSKIFRITQKKRKS